MQGNSHGLLIRGSCVQVAYGSLPETHASRGLSISPTLENPSHSISTPSLGHTFGHRRPKALDLYCGAGGVSVGLHHAGFDVVGVDIEPQPRYPFEFQRADALEFPVDGYDFIWASPPCQRYSAGAAKWGTQDNHPDLIAPTRLRIQGYPYVIENIQPALRHLRAPILLCGQMFGLGVFRHRLFESSLVLLAPPPPDSRRQGRRWEVSHGDGTRGWLQQTRRMERRQYGRLENRDGNRLDDRQGIGRSHPANVFRIYRAAGFDGAGASA